MEPNAAAPDRLALGDGDHEETDARDKVPDIGSVMISSAISELRQRRDPSS
jgi:hypothetical protein